MAQDGPDASSPSVSTTQNRRVGFDGGYHVECGFSWSSHLRCSRTTVLTSGMVRFHERLRQGKEERTVEVGGGAKILKRDGGPRHVALPRGRVKDLALCQGQPGLWVGYRVVVIVMLMLVMVVLMVMMRVLVSFFSMSGMELEALRLLDKCLTTNHTL